MEEVRWGIIGGGDVCEVKAGPAFQKANGSKLVAVMRRTASKAKDFAERHGVPRWYSDVESFFNDQKLHADGINAVYIATPPGSHLELALKCAEKGLPTYVEKPAARNAAETREMVEAFESRGVPLFVAYYRRGQERFAKGREVVASGELGAITSLTYTMVKPASAVAAAGELPWRLRAEYAGGGLVMDVGCHTVDVVDFILGANGPLRDVRGIATRSRGAAHAVEDGVALTARFGEGALAAMTWSFVGPPGASEDEILVRGTRGELRLSTFGDEPVRVMTAAVDGVRTVAAHPFARPAHVHQPLVQMVVDELRGVPGRPPCPSRGDNAVRAAEALDAALESFYRGRSDAFWTREGEWGQDA